MNTRDPKSMKTAALTTPSSLGSNAVHDVAAAFNALLADMFALYMKTKNFHWHVSGPHFRDYHLLLDEHGDQIFATADAIAERVRKIGGTIGAVHRPHRPPAADPGQRRGLRDADGHAGGTARRQQTTGGEHARDA